MFFHFYLKPENVFTRIKEQIMYFLDNLLYQKFHIKKKQQGQIKLFLHFSGQEMFFYQVW